MRHRLTPFLFVFTLLFCVQSTLLTQSRESDLTARITFMIGNRQAAELNALLRTIDFGKLSPEDKGSVVIAYSELYSWGGAGYDHSERAYELAERMLREHPEHWKSHYAMVVVLSHRIQKNNILALALIGKVDYHLSLALKYGKDRWEPHYLAGVRYLEVPLLPDLKRAEELLNRALELEPNHVFTYLMLGKLHERKGDFCKALDVYLQGLKRGVRPDWKFVDEDARTEIEKRIPEVSRKCSKR